MQQYLLTEDQKGLIAMVREFYQKEVLPIRAACDEEERTPMDVIQKAMEMGLHVLDIPEEYGGAGLDFQTYVMLIEEMCKVDDAFTSIINAGSIACKVVELGGTQEQKEHFYRKVVDGAFIGMCITEAGAGSDVSSIATTAVRDGDEYILNGTKLFVSNGSIADTYYRRILCNRLGELVECGQYPTDEKALGKIIENVCGRNAAAFLQL